MRLMLIVNLLQITCLSLTSAYHRVYLVCVLIMTPHIFRVSVRAKQRKENTCVYWFTYCWVWFFFFFYINKKLFCAPKKNNTELSQIYCVKETESKIRGGACSRHLSKWIFQQWMRGRRDGYMQHLTFINLLHKTIRKIRFPFLFLSKLCRKIVMIINSCCRSLNPCRRQRRIQRASGASAGMWMSAVTVTPHTFTVFTLKSGSSSTEDLKQ